MTHHLLYDVINPYLVMVSGRFDRHSFSNSMLKTGLDDDVTHVQTDAEAIIQRETQKSLCPAVHTVTPHS